MDYMPKPSSEDDIQLSNNITSDKSIISDESGIPNVRKWERIKEVFRTSDHVSLFSDMAYGEVFLNDENNTSEAAAFMADMRCQLLAYKLTKEPDSRELHRYYILNKQWYVRFRERSRMKFINESSRKFGILH